jgi:hypothetical protein
VANNNYQRNEVFRSALVFLRRIDISTFANTMSQCKTRNVACGSRNVGIRPEGTYYLKVPTKRTSQRVPSNTRTTGCQLTTIMRASYILHLYDTLNSYVRAMNGCQLRTS